VHGLTAAGYRQDFRIKQRRKIARSRPPPPPRQRSTRRAGARRSQPGQGSRALRADQQRRRALSCGPPYAWLGPLETRPASGSGAELPSPARPAGRPGHGRREVPPDYISTSVSHGDTPNPVYVKARRTWRKEAGRDATKLLPEAAAENSALTKSRPGTRRAHSMEWPTAWPSP
jgi:hypothetical protein